MTIYEIGYNGYWTGRTKSIPDDQGAPLSWTRIEVPALANGEYALWTGIWSVVNTQPARVYLGTAVNPATGSQGIQGNVGPQGVQGNVGLTGSQGIQGIQGISSQLSAMAWASRNW
jgi:hypothetical protein